MKDKINVISAVLNVTFRELKQTLLTFFLLVHLKEDNFQNEKNTFFWNKQRRQQNLGHEGSDKALRSLTCAE